jgi:dTDP-4-amino-4,6-dideoxygalactose transaminase/predicted dehydrogenase
MIKSALRGARTQLRQAGLDTMCKLLMAAPTGGRAPFNFEELKMVRAALLSQNLCCVDGHMVPEFERRFGFAYGVPYGVASTSGTAAIHVALGALDLNPGDEVITAPITDMGTIIPILSQGAIPVFADVDQTLNMDPAAVEKCITPRTKAIIAVHLFGNPCDMDAMSAVARKYQLPLIEDCSQAHWTEYKGRLVGTIGDIGCFSFQQSKHMTTGDGGMTITSNSAYYERMKLFADKGYARKGWGARAYLMHAPNYRMTELVGAVGLVQLGKVQAVVEKRRELGEHLTRLLSRVDGVVPAPVTPGAKHSYWLYPMRVEGHSAEAVAEEMIRQKLWVSAGYTGKPIYLCSESLAAKKTYGTSEWPFNCNPGITYEYREGLCPNAEAGLKHIVCIPFDESRGHDYVERIAAVVSSAIGKLGTRAAVGSPAAAVAPSASSSRPASPKSQTAKVRVGIVGCGQMGRWHLDAYARNPHVQLVGFVDTSIGRAEQFAREVGGRAYSSHQELLKHESLDAVSLCSVPSTHRDIAIDLLDAGVNVLCEKPLAISVAQAEEMASSAKQNNRLLFTAFKFRFHDEVRKAKQLIDAGSLGRVVSFRLMFGGYIDMKDQWYAQKAISGGGIIMDNGPHAADLIRFLFGGIRSVAAQVANVQKLDVEDTARLDVIMDHEVAGTSDLSWSLRIPARSYLEVYGEDGAASLDAEGISYKFKTWSEWKREPNQLDAKGAFARQINYFVEATQGNNPLALGNGEGVASQRVIDAAYESVRQDRRINITPLEG